MTDELLDRITGQAAAFDELYLTAGEAADFEAFRSTAGRHAVLAVEAGRVVSLHRLLVIVLPSL